MTLIHLQVNTQFACGSIFVPGTTLQQFNHQMTGEPRAVNCEMCKKTNVFKVAMEKIPK